MQQSQQNHDEKDNPALSKVIERNIRTIIHLRTKAARERSLQGRIADAITSFSGRMIFAYVHIVWFGVWILLNTGRLGVRAFDPFPYGLLTMVVSLEAIFLSTFVLTSQNRRGEESERRADLDLHIGLLTEQFSVNSPICKSRSARRSDSSPRRFWLVSTNVERKIASRDTTMVRSP